MRSRVKAAMTKKVRMKPVWVMILCDFIRG